MQVNHSISNQDTCITPDDNFVRNFAKLSTTTSSNFINNSPHLVQLAQADTAETKIIVDILQDISGLADHTHSNHDFHVHSAYKIDHDMYSAHVYNAFSQLKKIGSHSSFAELL